MSENHYAVTWPGVDAECARELASELESLGLTYRPTQAGASPQEIVEVVVAWISLKEVLVGAASGVTAAAIERLAAKVHEVVKKRGKPKPEARHKIHVFVHDSGGEFRCTVDIDVDQVPAQETIQASLEAAEQMHKNHMKAFRERANKSL